MTLRTRNEDRISVAEVPLLGVSDLVTLPKGQGFAMLSGGHLWKIRIPLVEEVDEQALPATLRHMANAMERSYITNDHWYRQREPWWLTASPPPSTELDGPANASAGD